MSKNKFIVIGLLTLIATGILAWQTYEANESWESAQAKTMSLGPGGQVTVQMFGPEE